MKYLRTYEIFGLSKTEKRKRFLNKNIKEINKKHFGDWIDVEFSITDNTRIFETTLQFTSKKQGYRYISQIKLNNDSLEENVKYGWISTKQFKPYLEDLKELKPWKSMIFFVDHQLHIKLYFDKDVA